MSHALPWRFHHRLACHLDESIRNSGNRRRMRPRSPLRHKLPCVVFKCQAPPASTPLPITGWVRAGANVLRIPLISTKPVRPQPRTTAFWPPAAQPLRTWRLRGPSRPPPVTEQARARLFGLSAGRGTAAALGSRWPRAARKGGTPTPTGMRAGSCPPGTAWPTNRVPPYHTPGGRRVATDTSVPPSGFARQCTAACCKLRPTVTVPPSEGGRTGPARASVPPPAQH